MPGESDATSTVVTDLHWWAQMAFAGVVAVAGYHLVKRSGSIMESIMGMAEKWRGLVRGWPSSSLRALGSGASGAQ